MKFEEITVETTTECSELVADILWEYSEDGVAVLDFNDVKNLIENKSVYYWDYIDEELINGDTRVFVKAYLPLENFNDNLTEIESKLKTLKAAATINTGSLNITKGEIDGDAWRDVWKKNFKPKKIGKAVICPEWIEYIPADDEKLIKIGSNMAFGTGEHETTSMCIKLLEKYLKPEDTVIDVGCGSGILGITAKKFGAKKVVMTDIDDCAVKAAKDNAQLNNVEAEVICTNLTENESIKGDLVLANITADILIGFSKDVKRNVKESGIIILSGIINSKLNDVLNAYKTSGFDVIETINDGEWNAAALSRKKQAVVFTLGCKVNGSESDSLIKGLINKGYAVSDELVYADLYIVNTCAVTMEAERKSRQMVSRITAINPDAKIIFTGCASQNAPEDFLNKSNVTVVTGALNKSKILDLLDKTGEFIEENCSIYDEMLPSETLKTRTNIKVQDGCDNFCSYCIIPYLRKRSRSRNPENVINEIEAVGSYEVVINGINLSSYNYEGVDLTGLCERLKNVNKRIRFGSLEVNVITDGFLIACKNLKDFAEQFHLSLQSGSNSVLKSMNRHYTREEFINKVELIRKYFPNAGITTDIICGFPTETERDFEDTLDLVKTVEFSDVHCFPYSARKGTVSFKMKDLDKSIKKERAKKLTALKNVYKEKFINNNLGRVQVLIPEEFNNGYTEGYSGNYIRLYYKGKLDNKPVKVKLTESFKDGALCVLL